MFTSRAEYRLRLRADNADTRLTALGVEAGCVGEKRATFFNKQNQRLIKAERDLRDLKASPNRLRNYGILVNHDGIARSAFELLGNKDINFLKICKVWPEIKEVSRPVLEFVKTNSLYESYITRQDADIRAYRKDEMLMLPSNLSFESIGGLSSEAKQALISTKPRTLGHASRVPGVTPAAVMILMRYVKSGKTQGKKASIVAAE